MSTSKNRHTPIAYMSAGPNVLWTLAPRGQSDSSYHFGADVSSLSQFATEDEVTPRAQSRGVESRSSLAESYLLLITLRSHVAVRLAACGLRLAACCLLLAAYRSLLTTY